MNKSMFVAIFASIATFTAPTFADNNMVVAMLDTSEVINTESSVTSTEPLEVTITPMAAEKEAVTPAARLRELNLAFVTTQNAPKRNWDPDALPISGKTWETLVIDWRGEVGDPKIAADAGRGRIAFVVRPIEKGFDPSPYNDADKGLKDMIGFRWKRQL